MANENLNKIFLIGNGFDLSHGLKTSYKDFISWYIYQCIINAYDNKGYYEDDCLKIKVTYSRFTNNASQSLDVLRTYLLNKKIDLFDKIPQDHNLIDLQLGIPQIDIPLIIVPKHNFIRIILEKCLDCDWHGIENEIYRFLAIKHHQLKMHFNDNNLPVNSKDHKFYKETTSQVNSLNSSVKHLKNKLIEYLRTQNKPTKNKLNLFDHVLADASPDTDCLFLNFNYTNYFYHDFSILTQRFKTPKINKLNIHGSLNSE